MLVCTLIELSRAGFQALCVVNGVTGLATALFPSMLIPHLSKDTMSDLKERVKELEGNRKTFQVQVGDHPERVQLTERGDLKAFKDFLESHGVDVDDGECGLNPILIQVPYY